MSEPAAFEPKPHLPDGRRRCSVVYPSAGIQCWHPIFDEGGLCRLHWDDLHGIRRVTAPLVEPPPPPLWRVAAASAAPVVRKKPARQAATRPDDYRCVATTLSGDRCRRENGYGPDLTVCHIHGYRQAPVAPERMRLDIPDVVPAVAVIPMPTSALRDGGHVLRDEINRRAASMWRYAPWNQRRRISRRYEGVA